MTYVYVAVTMFVIFFGLVHLANHNGGFSGTDLVPCHDIR